VRKRKREEGSRKRKRNGREGGRGRGRGMGRGRGRKRRVYRQGFDLRLQLQLNHMITSLERDDAKSLHLLHQLPKSDDRKRGNKKVEEE
jgi:hypothetical protein